MLNATFLKRMLEQMVVAFLVAFGGMALGTGGSLTRDAVGGAVAAGLRAVYGVFVKDVGESDSPSVN